MVQGITVAVADQNDITSGATIAPIRSSKRLVFASREVDATIPTLAGLGADW
jgi:hypothetical protein